MYCVIVVAVNEGMKVRRQLTRLAHFACDFIVVDGGSGDGSLDPIILARTRIAAKLTQREAGLGTALRCGLMYARDRGYSGVITMDGNGKDGVDAIPRFIEKLEEGYDLVQGSRFMPGGHHDHTPNDRLFGIKWIVAPAVRHASGYPFTDPTNGFRGLSMRLIEHAGMDLFRPCFVRFNFQLYLLCRAPRLGLMLTEWTIRGSWDL